MKLDLEDNNVNLVEMTVAQVRELVGLDGMPEDIDLALDGAQAHVFGGDYPKAFVVIEIVK